MTDRLFDFSGKVALITGGSRGMGREMAKAFAERGADIVITSRKLDSCREVAAEVEKLGRRALPYACNVAHWQELEGLADAAYAAFGKVDILVNNAGSSPLAPSSLETSEQLFDRIVHLNFKGPFRLMSLVGSRMAAGNGGSIINISSVGAIRPRPSIAPYAGAKAALNAITTAFAFEYGPKVRVNAIMPGRFLTDISKAWTEEARQNTGVALQRSGKPEEIVTAALYLASEHSGFTTGSVIQVDGGIA
ncbi:SDR family NAD(P)-dependent oxidoreductase [Reyranella sp. CPCC 100927]|uniref:SDR family NAD(P)-dependent oxidoreductase n=1 Tax=Reyranella sp. CPCC 100927 TaxID=2599616 RepID=UPI0011B5336E|nr:glucose 1-dehydrogenase [Reyranella sp. CPCC 100927]TWS99394.1 glucose 1-dehydrogenase [Reyranella sp. CPCC 100927]